MNYLEPQILVVAKYEYISNLQKYSFSNDK